MPINELPPEITSAIFDELSQSDKTQLLLCRLVSKDFMALATPAAFNTLFFGIRTGSACQPDKCRAASLPAFQRRFDVSPVFAHVKEINVTFHDLDRIHSSYLVGELRYMLICELGEIANSFKKLAKFPALRSLRLYFPLASQESRYAAIKKASPVKILQVGIVRVLGRLALDDQLRLVHLELDGLLGLPNRSLLLKEMHNLFWSLTNLEIFLVTEEDSQNPRVSNAAYTTFCETNLFRVLSFANNLSNLILTNDSLTSLLRGDDWEKLNFPNLKHLRLGDVVFITNTPPSDPNSYKTSAESFILHHRDTLENLDLSGCYLEIPSPDEGCQPRTWAMVWEGFEAELLGLKSFVYDPLPGRGSGGSKRVKFNGYVTHHEEVGYIPTYINKSDEDPVDAALDHQAFESLQKMICRNSI